MRNFYPVKIIRREQSASRALLDVSAQYGEYQIRISEIIEVTGERKYSYPVLKYDRVIVGFDNTSNPRALKLRYEKDYQMRLGERISHGHSKDKKEISLTEEMDC